MFILRLEFADLIMLARLLVDQCFGYQTEVEMARFSLKIRHFQ
jgi:hypothetical protein